jgi:hypothetical protein
MKKCMLALLVLAFTAGFLIQFPARVFAGPAEDVQAAMLLLKSRLRRWVHPLLTGRRQSPARLFPPYILEQPR